jgi:hypothetical protein
MKQYFEDRKENWKHYFISGKDLNYSFAVIAEKGDYGFIPLNKLNVGAIIKD